MTIFILVEDEEYISDSSYRIMDVFSSRKVAVDALRQLQQKRYSRFDGSLMESGTSIYKILEWNIRDCAYGSPTANGTA